MALEMILALGITAFLFLYYAFKADNQHFLLKLLLLFFFLSTMILLASETNQPDCAMMQSNRTINTTQVNYTVEKYSYNLSCVPNGTPNDGRLLNVIMWFAVAFAIYMFVYLTYHWGEISTAFGRKLNKGKD